MSSAELVTYKHVKRVNELLIDSAQELLNRAKVHDNSKFEAVELGPLQDMQDLIDKEGQAPFGTDEYKRRTSLLGPMIKHHYENNTHHPEHYPNGINGMDIFDVVEMLMDWKAASERGEESEINLTASKERFSISDQLMDIFRNTYSNLQYKFK